MMKKMLVLALVLAVAGLANAGLSLVAAGDSAQLVSDDNGDYYVFLAIKDPVKVLGNYSLFQPPAGVGSSVVAYPITAGGDRLFEVVLGGGVVSGSVVPNQPGIQFSVLTDKPLSTEGPVVAAVMYADDLETVLGTLYTVPEPMTMGLLGLGALFLRKRK